MPSANIPNRRKFYLTKEKVYFRLLFKNLVELRAGNFPVPAGEQRDGPEAGPKFSTTDERDANHAGRSEVGA